MPFKRPLFKPSRPVPRRSATGGGPLEAHDAYTFEGTRIVDAVNIAMAARRPLLVTGAAGSGKSTLASAVAREMGWAYSQHVVTSRTEIGDLTANFDAVRRLADAQAEGVLPDWCYVRPGVLWWAYSPTTAPTRGHDPKTELEDDQLPRLPPVIDPRVRDDEATDDIVVLIDEIDKAEPDLPNDLLEPLDRRSFTVPGVPPIEAGTEVFVVITSNGERRLPPAFLRRCVQLDLPGGTDELLVRIARVHFGPRRDTLFADVAREHLRFVEAARAKNRREPSTAEFLDTLRACLHFREAPGTGQWEEIVRVALWKESELPELASDDDPDT